jgi:hypothetical protein
VKFTAEATFAVVSGTDPLTVAFSERDGTTDGGLDEIDAVHTICQRSAAKSMPSLNVRVAQELTTRWPSA